MTRSVRTPCTTYLHVTSLELPASATTAVLCGIEKILTPLCAPLCTPQVPPPTELPFFKSGYANGRMASLQALFSRLAHFNVSCPTDAPLHLVACSLPTFHALPMRLVPRLVIGLRDSAPRTSFSLSIELSAVGAYPSATSRDMLGGLVVIRVLQARGNGRKHSTRRRISYRHQAPASTANIILDRCCRHSRQRRRIPIQNCHHTRRLFRQPISGRHAAMTQRIATEGQTNVI